MRFCTWYPIAGIPDEGETAPPSSPGMLQVRLAAGLQEYPSGKSAMLHYEVSADVRAAVVGFATDHAKEPWVIRHTIEMTASDIAGIAEFADELTRTFEQRFGCAPKLFLR